MAEHKLPIKYVCRKCSKTYSSMEYEQSRFCRVCGSFLLRNFRDERYVQMLSQKSFSNKVSTSELTESKPDGSFRERIALTSAIWALISQLEPNLSLITYNGRSFDIPYIKQRLAYYGLDAPLDNTHFDVLHFTRRALRHKLADCKLETVEKYIGIKRDINIPGALVPHFYDTYLRTKNAGPLVAIVEHNRQDLLTLGTLFSRLYEEWNLD